MESLPARMKAFEKLYCLQAGGGDDYPVFRGSRYMKGHGFLGRLFGKVATPLWKLVGKNLLSAGLNVADDVISKKRKFKDAFGVHGRAAGRNALDDTKALLNRSMTSMDSAHMEDMMDHGQTGSGMLAYKIPIQQQQQQQQPPAKRKPAQRKPPAKKAKGKKKPANKSVKPKTPKRKVKKEPKSTELPFFRR